ncbi:hypothetical protein ABG768_012378 [Culter alburnus]|uniref:Ig-like domain-containing protein n=1 Tax=Culter alburnus TaxID=194366 RepID=A0AAW1ZD12_CULAL
MEKILFFCVFSCRIIQITSSDVSEHHMTLLRFQLNEAISLDCNMTDRYEITWYHQNPDSGRLTLLMIAKTSSVSGKKTAIDADTGITRVSLVITGLKESDSGLYFCGTKSVTSEMHFDKPIRLEIEGKLTDREDKCDCVTEAARVVEVTDGVTVTERVLMFGGVGLAAFVFFLATFIAGGIIHHHGWQKGWKEAKRASLMSQKSAK